MTPRLGAFVRKSAAVAALSATIAVAGPASPAHAGLIGGLLGTVTGVVGGVVGILTPGWDDNATTPPTMMTDVTAAVGARSLWSNGVDGSGVGVALIDSGLPSGSDDTEVRLLCELGGSAGRNPLMASLLTTLYDRQVGMYQVVLEQGAARGLFALAQPTLVIARNLVALEDAYGYRIVAKHPTLDRAAAAELLREYARLATGHALTS